MKKEIRFSGFGGQGVILMGHIFGEAAVMDGKDATLTKSYGPEARGGACSSDIIISDDRVHYPQVRNPDVLISMSQESLETYKPELTKEGMLIIDTGLVESSRSDVLGLPATKMAEEEVGIKQVANIVMIGYLTALMEFVSKGSMKEAVEKLVPEGTEEKNLEAFELGYKKGEEDR